MRRSFFRRPTPVESKAFAIYRGKDGSDRHQWEVDGQLYTSSVSTIGGGTPAEGKSYPALANQPDSRSQWVALVRPKEKLLYKPFGAVPANWPQYLQGYQRRAFGRLPAEWVGGEDYLITDTYDGTLRTRIWGSSVYTLKSTNWVSPNYRHTLVETTSLEAGAPQVRSYYNATGIVEMLVTEDAIYLVEWLAGARVLASARIGHGWNAGVSQTSSRVRKLRRSDFAVLWTSTATTSRLIRPAPSLAIMDGQLVCLCETVSWVGDWYRPRLVQLTLNVETGAQIGGLVNLAGEDPEFLMVSNQFVPSWTSEPTSYGTQPIDVFPEEEYRQASSWGPWLNSSTLSPAWDNAHATDGTLYWSESMTPAMHDCARFHNWYVWPDRHLPSPRRGQQLTCFDSTGAVKWRRRGWDKEGIREVFTVVSAHPDGRMLVLVEENTFQDHSCSDATWAVEKHNYGGSGGAPAWDYWVGSGGAAETRYWRFIKDRKLFFEVLSASDGAVLEREQISTSVSRTVTLPTGSPTIIPTYEVLGIVEGVDYEYPLPSAIYPTPVEDEDIEALGICSWTNPPFSPRINGVVANSGTGVAINKAFAGDKVTSGVQFLLPASYYPEAPPGYGNPLNIQASRGSQILWDIVNYELTFPAPLGFDPYSCCLSADGSRIVFSPFWRPFWGDHTTDNEIQMGRNFLRKPGTASPTYAVENWLSGEKLNQKIQMPAFDWNLNKSWEYEFAVGGGTRHFTQANLLGLEGGQILWHFRRSNATTAYTQPGPGNVGYFHRVNANTGALVSTRTVENLAPSPLYSGGVYGELDQHRTAFAPQRHPTEVLYAGDGFLVTKMGNRQVFIT